jgi:hypothetical protein
MTKTDQFWKQNWRNAKREMLDADMRPSDLVDVLRRLKFDEPYCLIGLDRPVRDYLVAALTDTRRK